MNIIKRNGEEVVYDGGKIISAIAKANAQVPESTRMSEKKIAVVEDEVRQKLEEMSYTPGVEEIQNLVVAEIGRLGHFVVQKEYTEYRYKRSMVRQANTTDEQLMSLLEDKNEEVKQENSNKNPTILSVQRDYMAGTVSKDLCDRFLLPANISQAHKEGVIHFHDTDYFVQKMYNCCLVNLEDMLNNETNISGTHIDRPKSIETAATVASQIIAQVASSQYGGQTFNLGDFVGARHESAVNFVDITRQKEINAVQEEHGELGIEITEEQTKAIAEKRLIKRIENAMQTIQYQLVTLQSTNGQAPFVTMFMYLNECKDERKKEDLALLIKVVLEQRIKGVKNRQGVYVTPAFPKIVYTLEKDNISEGSKYWDLTVLAAKCTAKRMVPDYLSEKVMLDLKGFVYPPMGCRSFLTPDHYGLENGESKYYGRFNQGVVTINLVDIACSSGKNEDRFWEIFEDRMENLVHKALQIRHNHLLGTKSDVAPILWQDGAIARLQPGETIDKLLMDNYSTISVGYAGLAECVQYMKDVSHTSEAGKEFGLRVMEFLNDKCTAWRNEEHVSYSVYGTPIESTTYKFAKCLQKRFGVIPGVTDKGYITNSYHVRVTEAIDAFSKLSKEAEFQALSPGGAISYVEVPNMTGNIEAVLAIMKHIYQTIMYAELNTKSDYCTCCGYDKEIQIVEDENKKLVWECPNCGNRDQTKMSVARRTCGYIGTQYWNQGRTEEIRERVTHVAVR